MNTTPGLPNGGLPRTPFQSSTAGMSEQEAQMVRGVQMAMESCVGKSMMSGVMGFALGGAFGLFMSSVSFFLTNTFHSYAYSDNELDEL
jgi:mitochondrial import inner membrane translocase subunit TIM22